jgi:hypothetical protein
LNIVRIALLKQDAVLFINDYGGFQPSCPNDRI